MVAVIAVGFGMAAVMSDGLNADWIPMVHPYRFLDWLRLLPVDWFWILFAGRSVIFDKALAFFGVGWIVFYGTFRFHRRFERDEFDRLLRANPRDLDRLVAPLRSALAKLEAQPPLRWVLFDVGNVLITVKHRIVSEQLLKTCPDPHQTRVVQQAIDTFIFDPGEATAPNAQLDRGVKQLEWLRHDLCQRFPVKVSEAAFTEIWLSVFAKSSNADVLDCLTRLWLQGFQIALCSNTNREHWSFITDHFPDIRHLSQQVPCFLSYQMGMIKTDPGFFEAVAKSTQSDYSNHVLVDDDQRNCRSAQQAGMQVIRFSDGKISSLANEVNRLLTQVDNRTPTGNHVRSTLQERTP
jgi:FMN phosphatase YigB (HAD superfamily)